MSNVASDPKWGPIKPKHLLTNNSPSPKPNNSLDGLFYKNDNCLSNSRWRSLHWNLLGPKQSPIIVCIMTLWFFWMVCWDMVVLVSVKIFTYGVATWFVSFQTLQLKLLVSNESSFHFIFGFLFLCPTVSIFLTVVVFATRSFVGRYIPAAIFGCHLSVHNEISYVEYSVKYFSIVKLIWLKRYTKILMYARWY